MQSFPPSNLEEPSTVGRKRRAAAEANEYANGKKTKAADGSGTSSRGGKRKQKHALPPLTGAERQASYRARKHRSAATSTGPTSVDDGLVDANYISTHPDELFYHVGKGRWARGPPPLNAEVEFPGTGSALIAARVPQSLAAKYEDGEPDDAAEETEDDEEISVAPRRNAAISLGSSDDDDDDEEEEEELGPEMEDEQLPALPDDAHKGAWFGEFEDGDDAEMQRALQQSLLEARSGL